MSRNATVTDTLRSMFAAARSEQITFLAASLAYYAFVSVMPLLLLVVVVASAAGGEELAVQVVGQLRGVLSPSGQELLVESLTDARGRGQATVAGGVVLVWGTLKVFRGLEVAFAMVYGTSGSRGFVGKLIDAAVTLLAVGLGVTAVVAASVLLGRANIPVANVLGTPALAAALTITFLPLYVLLPNADVTIPEALPGAVVAGGGWAVLGTLFRIYAELAGGFQLYGVIGGVLLLVTWFYLAGIVLLLGGVVNAVLAGRFEPEDGNRQVQHASTPHIGQRASMSDDNGGSPAGAGAETGDAESRDAAEERTETAALEDELATLRADLEAVEERTVHRDEIESDLRAYVRRRVRRGHAHGWGPYLVLLYGTVMTLGAFYFLSGGWAILAMLVVWLSTLGLYALMLLVGLTATVVGLPGRLRESVRQFRR